MRLVALAFICCATAAQADFIETTWTVTKFAGEASQIDPEAAIGQTQAFDGGWADGVFYACDFGGQSMGYETFPVDDFLASADYAVFALVADDLRAGGDMVFVHTISCDAPSAVLYPFVTTPAQSQAFYAIGDGVFTLEAH
jgi:hypothetical protein